MYLRASSGNYTRRATPSAAKNLSYKPTANHCRYIRFVHLGVSLSLRTPPSLVSDPSSFFIMTGDILKKRKIAVLGARSVGRSLPRSPHHHPIVQTRLKTSSIAREIVPCHPVHREPLCRVLLSYNRSNFSKERQLQWHRVRLRYHRYSRAGQRTLLRNRHVYCILNLQTFLGRILDIKFEACHWYSRLCSGVLGHIPELI